MAPSALARIRFAQSIPPSALEDLEGFSHLWVLFIFHENTDLHRERKLGRAGETFPGKVAPPMLGGKKVGLFSTRTPHRPNPIGLSAVRIVEVDPKKRLVVISGHDLVDGTPVLDVKPYIPAYDSLEAKSPEWTRLGPRQDRMGRDADGWEHRSVEFAPGVAAAIEQDVVPRLSHFDSASSFMRALAEILELDIRSVYQGKGKGASGEDRPYIVRLDGAEVTFVTLEQCIRVTAAAPVLD